MEQKKLTKELIEMKLEDINNMIEAFYDADEQDDMETMKSLSKAINKDIQWLESFHLSDKQTLKLCDRRLDYLMCLWCLNMAKRGENYENELRRNY